MKILVLKPYIVARTNGGEISLLEKLRIFKSWGHEIQIHIALPSSERSSTEKLLRSLETPLNDDIYVIDELRCQVKFHSTFHAEHFAAIHAMKDHFLRILEREQPDLVWVHYTDYFAVNAALEWNADKTWVNITDNEYPRQVTLNLMPMLGLSYVKIKNVMVASAFMQRAVSVSLPQAKVLLLPSPVDYIVNPNFSRTEKHWLFVNTIAVKGLAFMQDLARALPSESFLFIGNWASDCPKDLPPNVIFMPRQKSLLPFFKESKGLLMPSVWEEAFGRIVIEAMACGVPVIASTRGALPETVGNGGICLPLILDVWINVMRAPKEFFEELSKRGLKRAAAYQSQRDQIYLTIRQSPQNPPQQTEAIIRTDVDTRLVASSRKYFGTRFQAIAASLLFVGNLSIFEMQSTAMEGFNNISQLALYDYLPYEIGLDESARPWFKKKPLYKN